MRTASLNPAHQLVIITRIAEFCRWRGAIMNFERDPWEYMRQKLLQTEPAIAELKTELYHETAKQLLADLKRGSVSDDQFADYKQMFERLLSRGDFADVAIHLHSASAGPDQLRWVEDILRHVSPTHLFLEERKPLAERSPAWEKLVAEMAQRLDLDRLGQVLARKPRTNRRKWLVLRRMRRNMAEYCSVVHIPTQPGETFTPFMLPRIEAVIAANLRFLTKYR